MELTLQYAGKIVARPLHLAEPDLLVGHEHDALIITGPDGEELQQVQPPATGWTHDLLESIDYNTIAPFCWDAYLGSLAHWIGSSET